MTSQDLAELLEVPVHTVYDWRYRQIGPTAIKMGRHIRYEVAEVERWLAWKKASSQ